MTKPHLKPSVVDLRTRDSFQNFVARMGVGANQQFGAGHYGFNPMTRLRLELEFAYRGSWLVGRVTDCIADDMCREGVKQTGAADNSDHEKTRRHAESRGVWTSLADALRWARLYGGGIGWMMIDGQDPATPLKIDTIGKDQFKGIHPMDRWQLQPTLDNLVRELGPELGNPKFYDTINDTNITGLGRVRIHHSRIIRLLGIKLPLWQAITENLWGESVIERMWDRLIAFDSTTQGAAQLVFKAYLRTLKIPGLRDLLGAGGQPKENLLAMVNFMRTTQSIEGVTLIDGEDELDYASYQFSGLDKLLGAFGEQLAGATETPLVRLFGQSPAGFSTGDAEIENYNSGTIKPKQEAQLRLGTEKLYQVMFRSATGLAPPEDYGIEFNPLKAMEETEQAEIGAKLTQAIIMAIDGGTVRRATGLKELRRISDVAGGLWSSIEEDEINEAENDPPPSPEALGLTVPEPVVSPGAKAGGPGKDVRGPAKKGGPSRGALN